VASFVSGRHPKTFTRADIGGERLTLEAKPQLSGFQTSWDHVIFGHSTIWDISVEMEEKMAIYSVDDLSRREILKMSAVLASSAIVLSTAPAAGAAALQRTPGQILGPFYPLKELPRSADLTSVPGRTGRAAGQVLNVMGRVLNLAGEPVRDATVEVWQANSYGRYTHPSDTNPAQLDPNFDGSAVLVTDTQGRYRFKTIKPAAYPAGPDLIRPAHIHFQVSGRQDRLVTQMYFENDPYNDKDPFLNSAGRKQLLITKLLDPSPEFEPDSKMATFDIVVYNG
jgi:protocatechuate 3,4-dioxygenase, beta subunit